MRACGTTSAYTGGCRCAACREAKRLYEEYRRRDNPDKVRASERARYAKNAERYRAQARQRRAANPGKFRNQAKERWRNNPALLVALRRWQKANPDKVRASGQRYRDRMREQNSGKVSAYQKAWRARNPEKVHAARLRYEWSARKARGHATDAQIEARINFFGGCCSYCGGPYEHLDHAIPLSCGGTNWPANLRPACAHCNLTKHARTAMEFVSGASAA